MTPYPRCKCCPLPHTSDLVRVGEGYMHFKCWEEHHSDPSGPWPKGHKCEGDQA